MIPFNTELYQYVQGSLAFRSIRSVRIYQSQTFKNVWLKLTFQVYDFYLFTRHALI